MTSRGFTLVEALVALVVACVSMAAAAKTALAVQRGGRASELLERASFVAGRGLEDRIARGPLGLFEENSADALEDDLGLFVRRTVVAAGPRENLWEIVVTVVPPRGATPVTLRTLVRRPWTAP